MVRGATAEAFFKTAEGELPSSPRALLKVLG